MNQTNTPVTLSIPKPCHENWQQMTPAEKGRFCVACQKTVYDFTRATDREILTEFHKDKQLCGRFNPSQLNRELVIPKQKSPLWLATTSALISFLGLASHNAYSQVKGNIKTEQTDKKVLGDTLKLANQEFKISGTVSDASGPFPGVTITVKGQTESRQTDLDGRYSIKTKIGDVLVFSFLGMQDEEIYVTEKTPLNLDIRLNDQPMGKMGETIVIAGGISYSGKIYKKRTFFGRLFHSIGNWFR